MLLCNNIPIYLFRRCPSIFDENDLLFCIASFCVKTISCAIYILVLMIVLPQNVIITMMYNQTILGNEIIGDDQWMICKNYLKSSIYFSSISVGSIILLQYALGPHKITSRVEKPYLIFAMFIDLFYLLFNLLGIFMQSGYFLRHMSECYAWDLNSVMITWFISLALISLVEAISFCSYYVKSLK